MLGAKCVHKQFSQTTTLNRFILLCLIKKRRIETVSKNTEFGWTNTHAKSHFFVWAVACYMASTHSHVCRPMTVEIFITSTQRMRAHTIQ